MKQAYNIPRLRPDSAGGEESGPVQQSLPAGPGNICDICGGNCLYTYRYEPNLDDPRFRDGEENSGLWPDEDEYGYPEDE